MDYKKFIEQYSLAAHPLGLGGCRNGNGFDCCEYNITIFDEKNEKNTVLEHDGHFVILHHGSMHETNSCVLVQLHDLKILHDEQWELQMFLSKLKSKKDLLYKDCAKNNLLESVFCTTRVVDSVNDSNNFASIWHKCSLVFLADGISSLNHIRSSPVHGLESLRLLEKNRINEKFSIVTDMLGLERATPVLLERMLKSTIGFSEIINGPDFSKIIRAKYDYLITNSLFSDCYFYLTTINRDNFFTIKNSIHKKPEYFHILKVAFDSENDSSKIQQDSAIIKKTANEIITYLSS